MVDGRSRLSGAMGLVRKSRAQFMDIYVKMDSLRFISRMGDDCGCKPVQVCVGEK